MTVQQWLQSEERDYEAGRQLYEQLGENARLKQVLTHGPNTYNRDALAWELGKLAKTDRDVALVLPAPASVAESATESLQTAPEEPTPPCPLLEELKQARRPLYDERTLLHGNLETLAEHASQDEVHEAAKRIMALSRQLNTSWATTAYVQAHGQLPPPPPPPPGLDTLSREELLRKRNNLRSQVSKLKKRPDRADDLAVAEATLRQVETLLTSAE